MKKYQKWVGRRLDDLRLPWEQFQILHPSIKKTNYRALRRYHKINGDTDMPPRHEHEPTQPNPEREVVNEQVIDGHVVQTVDGWYEMLTANPEDPENPIVTRLYKHSTTTRPTGEELFADWQPATPARITPSRKKIPKRDHEVYYIYGDTQIGYRRNDDNELIPLHDEKAMRVARLICRDLNPDLIVNLGDNVDNAELSRFKPDSDHFMRTMGPSYQRAHDYYAELRADNPNTRIVEVSSNHERRLRDWVLKYMPQMYGMQRPNEDDYPIMTYPYLANLKAVSVEWVGGYEAAELLVNGDLAFRHGREATSNGTTAAKIMKNHPETNNVHGHSHEMGMATKTLRSGQILASIVVGALCRTDGAVPGYHSAVDDNNQIVHRQQNWQQSVLAIYSFGEGRYQFDHIPIVNGKAFYQGKEYRGEE